VTRAVTTLLLATALAAYGAPAGETADEMLERAARLEDEGKTAEAVQLYGEIIEKYPDNAQAYNNFGALLVSAGKIPEAKYAFEKAAELDPDYDTPRNNLGYIYLRVEGDFEKAGPLLVAAVELNPYNESALNNLRYYYILQDKYEEAAAEWEKLSRLAPDSARIKRDLADIYIKLGDFDAGEKWAKATLALDADDLDARLNLAFIYRLTGRLGEAEKLLVKLAKTGADVVEVQVALRDVYFARGKYEDALAAAKAVTETGEEAGPEDFLALARIYYELGQYDDGLAACDRALQMRDDAAGHNIKGAGLYLAGRLDEAETELSLAVAREDRFADAHRNLADVYYQKWLFAEALGHYEKAYELNPGDQRALVMSGYCYYQLGDAEAAEAVFDDVLEEFPDNVKALSGKAAVLRARGDARGAYSYSARAVERSPGNAEALNTAGVLAAEVGDFDKSYEYFERLLALEPGPAYTYGNFGVAAVRTGRWEEAREAFEEALARDPKDFQARAGLALVAATLEPAKAAGAIAAAEELSPTNAVVLYARALEADAQGDAAARDEYLARVLEQKRGGEEKGLIFDVLSAYVFEKAEAAGEK
jgi:tetratricopeptide (TPR) repeat protein